VTSCDICVIGAGSAGLTVAAVASQFGQKVVLIEKGEMGGDCLNTGCVPSKALLAAAKQAQAMRKSGPFGISPVSPDIDFAKVMAHVRSVITAIEPNDSQERFEKLGVKVIRAAARFTAPDRVEAGGETISARRFVVATGSRAAVPPIPGLNAVPHFTNETLFRNTRCPEHLIVIGGGPIGLEMAQAHLRLGARVTVVEAFSPLAKDDPELARVVVEHLREEGVAIHDNAKILQVRQEQAGLAIDIEKTGVMTTLTGSHLLVAAGRKPNVENLGLEAAGIATDKRGIITDESLRTSNRRVYAIGDVAGGLQFTHVAGFHGALVVKHALFRLPVKKSATPIPWVTYTDPELAQVGLTEAEARKTHGEAVQVLRFPFHDNDRAIAERKTAGMAKIVVGRGGRILGAGIVGANAGEIIGPWALAMASGLKVKHLASMVFPYPTLGEINKRAAVTYYAGLAGKSWVRRLIGFLARFN
jgi:pyruvate/2-oxoglutarate dehydrogenase complex dihydrolipoamide dehydrogenase (E3) component